MFIVGVDVHLRKIVMHILDSNGKLVKEQTLSGDVSLFLMAVQSLKGDCAVCYEASCGYGHLHDRLSRLPNVKRVVVAHAGQLRLIFRSKKKNDRADARKLATLLFLDQVPAVHVPSVDVRAWRQMIEFRRKVVQKCTAIKNQLRAVLRTHGQQGPHRAALWTRKGMEWLEALALPTLESAFQRDVLVESLTQENARLKRVTTLLDETAQKHPGVQLLQTIPGVGPRTSEAVAAYIDDPRRFRRGKQVGSYFGLVPCQDQSADKNRLGHITKEGPATARKLLTEAAWQGIRRSPEIRAFFERVQGDDPGRKKIALVATAHWLLRVMYAMLLSGEAARFTLNPKKGEETRSAA